jgi:hypothetical protein
MPWVTYKHTRDSTTVINYNKYKIGVDMSYKMLAYYSFQRKSIMGKRKFSSVSSVTHYTQWVCSVNDVTRFILTSDQKS